MSKPIFSKFNSAPRPPFFFLAWNTTLRKQTVVSHYQRRVFQYGNGKKLERKYRYKQDKHASSCKLFSLCVRVPVCTCTHTDTPHFLFLPDPESAVTTLKHRPWLLSRILHANETGILEKTVNSRATERKVQDEPEKSHCSN